MRAATLFLPVVFGVSPAVAQTIRPYTIVDSLRVGPVHGDHYMIDAETRRLYGAGRYIVDIDRRAVVDSFSDSIPGEAFVVTHGTGHGISNYGLLFDLRTGRTISRVPFFGDGIAVDELSKRAFLFGHDTAAVIDVRTGALVLRMPTPGMKESAVSDGRGRVYANVEDSSAIAVIDARALRVLALYHLAPAGTHPTGLAIDADHHRLFAACDSVLVVVNADNGRVVATLPIKGHSDQNAFDPQTHLLFMPNGRGLGLTIVYQEAPNQYTVVQHLTDPLLTSVRVALDDKTHRAYLPHRFADGVLGFEVLAPARATAANSMSADAR